MAFTPCAWHGALYRGGANTAFIRLVEGGESVGGKLQVCANCATLCLDYLSDHAIKVSEGDQFYQFHQPTECSNCRGALNGSYSRLYANVYFRGRPESQWFGSICADCAGAVMEDLHLAGAA